MAMNDQSLVHACPLILARCLDNAVAGVRRRKIYRDLPSTGVIFGGAVRHGIWGFHPLVQQEQGSPITTGNSFETLIT